MELRTLARELAEGAIVLLKNDAGLLPFAPGQKIAFFGRAQVKTVLSGNGSGAADIKTPKSILDACREAGLQPVSALEAFYREKAQAEASAADGFDLAALKHMVNSGLMYEFFGKYTPPAPEYPVPDELLAASAAETDTALLVLGRQSGGEECDRRLHDDYELTAAEQSLLSAVCGAFTKVAVVLNVNGLIDLGCIEQFPSIRSLLFLGIPGEEGPAALARILTGSVSPSGKLAVTIAAKYEDYPAHADFSFDKDHPASIRTYADYGLDASENGSRGFAKSPVTVYREDLCLGYRYFDAFGKTPLFPFGFGLSYTQFSVDFLRAEKIPGGVQLSAAVRNTGDRPGREVVQLYLSARGTESPRAVRELKDFQKTQELAPGESETLTLFVPWREFAAYREKTADWVIERGAYLLGLGASSANTTPAARVDVLEDILVERCANRLGLMPCNAGKIDFFAFPRPDGALPEAPVTLTLTAAEVPVAAVNPVAPPQTDWNRFSLKELAALCVGYGPGTPFAFFKDTADPSTIFDETGAPITTNSHPAGYDGYVSPAIEQKGVRSVFYKDGPAGVGGVAWPSEMLLACSFDRAALRKFGDAVGTECEENQIDVWLAPAVNLHRHPLGGRNFEYFSEDPFLTGALACALTDGVQRAHPVLVCAKHFAVNEQETYRRGSAKLGFDAVDSILTERAARELYLKPFEMLIRQADLRCVMTSFNKINGTFAGGNRDLCTHILREEWGFDGAVVTDWGDMDNVVDGADAVAAGNDVVMPGGPPVIAQILAGYEENRVDLEALQTAAGHLFSLLRRFGRWDG